jgi:type I restriction enzyme S subunit
VKFIYPKEKLDSEFVYWFLKSSRSQALFTGMSRSAQAGFNKRDLAPLLIPIPSKAEQQEIIERLNSLMKICDQLESSFLNAYELAGKFARSVSSVSA